MSSIDRRTLFGVTLAAGSVLATNMKAYAQLAGDVQLRDQIEKLERLPTVGLESREFYRTALRKFVSFDLGKASNRRVDEIFAARGLDPTKEMPRPEVIQILKDDPILMNHLHAFLAVQQSMWEDLQAAFHGDADRYLDEMERADKSGPGTLELNPGMFIPDHAAWEVHNQPGGYVGDDFAGHMYHYGTNNFFLHRNDQDGIHQDYVKSIPVPADGKVNRCLDLGCGAGQALPYMKWRFPQAEVWGIDVGGPMVRYGHMRAVDLGVEVHFAQRLAEDTKFPDEHFDTISSFLLFHETTIEATQQIIREIFRMLRPGGTFFASEGAFRTERGPKTAQQQWRIWWNDQWCSEVHYEPYIEFDYASAFARAGFEMSTTPGPFNQTYMKATKPA